MEKKEFYSLGIMSGTSLDGLDFSLIKSNGRKKIKLLYNTNFSIQEDLKHDINQLIEKFNKFSFKKVLKSEFFHSVQLKFNNLILRKIKIFSKKNSFALSDIDVIGLHGNTLIHNPKKKISLQLGDASFLANKLKILFVSEFRNNDIFLGGQGAPLVPIYHQAIFSDYGKNVIVVNIGGISNFTLLVGKKIFLASDIGPGNVLIDSFCKKNFKSSFDNDGKLAASGKIINKYLIKWCKKKFIKKPAPKSFDNYYFKTINFLKPSTQKKDLLRTLTFFTAKIIADSKNLFNFDLDKWIFCGGGVKNLTLINDINSLLPGENILISDELGWDSSYIESQAFAFISIRTLLNLPSSYPNSTGTKKQNICGIIYKPD